MSNSANNVIIFGAGASFNAGIPMLRNFIDTMWNIARTGRCHGQPISDVDRKILEDALGVREDLDGYHGRAAFDMWNLEDLLSILSFNAMAGGRKEKNRLESVTKGIAKTIELTCRVKHDGNIHDLSTEGRMPLYENFWTKLISWSRDSGQRIPTIITFNYDLVLERSLLRTLSSPTHFAKDSARLPWRRLRIHYCADSVNQVDFNIGTKEWPLWDQAAERPYLVRGSELSEPTNDSESDLSEILHIRIFKLHGSVNFPRPHRGRAPQVASAIRLSHALDDPLILPPVFNKATKSLGGTTWADALNSLRACKNLVVCGYSLPATDIYMQYFLKAALGPNQDLNRLFVFDPVLFDNDKEDAARSLRSRYSSIFSESFRHRICFDPPEAPEKKGGTFHHLVSLLHKSPLSVLFG